MEKTPVSAFWQKRFSDHLVALPSLKKVRVQKIFSSSQLNYSRARCKYSIQKLKKAQPKLHLLEKSREEGSFGLACYLDKATRTRGGELTGRGGINTEGEVTVRAGARLVMN